MAKDRKDRFTQETLAQQIVRQHEDIKLAIALWDKEIQRLSLHAETKVEINRLRQKKHVRR